MYATEACGLNQSDIRPLDFVVNRFRQPFSNEAF